MTFKCPASCGYDDGESDVPVTEWISVKDSLPGKEKEVLTYSPKLKFVSKFLAAWFDGEDFWLDHQGLPMTDVTHWMPLPSPPEKD